MKTVFQIILIGAVLIILIDISSCSQVKKSNNLSEYKGQFIDIVTNKPVDHVNLSMYSSSGRPPIMTNTDANGSFRVAFHENENHNYSLYVSDRRYRVVNPNQRLHLQENQIWYLMPTGNP